MHFHAYLKFFGFTHFWQIFLFFLIHAQIESKVTENAHMLKRVDFEVLIY